jgi:hypothetical protein
MQFRDTPHRETVKQGRCRAVAATTAAGFPGNRATPSGSNAVALPTVWGNP